MYCVYLWVRTDSMNVTLTVPAGPLVAGSMPLQFVAPGG
jgi:hypothetical protein